MADRLKGNKKQFDLDDKPEAVAPRVESYEGVNFPYRGTQKHGVEVPKDAEYDTREFEYEGPDETEYLEPEDEPEPVAVRVVVDSARERLDWRASRARVSDVPVQVLGRHDKRKGVRIKVHETLDGDANTAAVYLGNDAGIRPYTGYELSSGEVVYPFVSTEDVWAVCEAGESVELSIMYEFAVEL